MSKIIELLEKIGQDAAFASSQNNAVSQALARADISPEIADALAKGDQRQLVALLGARTNVACMVFAVEVKSVGAEEPQYRNVAIAS